MKDFFAKERVRCTLTLIDWGIRYVKLLEESAPKHGRVLVTRPLQVRALLPHTLLRVSSDQGLFAANSEEGRPEGVDDSMGHYDIEEAAIRDCYDEFLDGLESFSSYLKTRLVTVDDLGPYLEYWIDSIHAYEKDADDAAWSAALVTFVHYYGYRRVSGIYKQNGR